LGIEAYIREKEGEKYFAWLLLRLGSVFIRKYKSRLLRISYALSRVRHGVPTRFRS
jgi:hypothetical protein